MIHVSYVVNQVVRLGDSECDLLLCGCVRLCSIGKGVGVEFYLLYVPFQI